jgi:hypothetical protein
MPPGPEAIDPGCHLVLLAAEPLDGEFALPAVVAERGHRRFGPRAFSRRAVSQDDCDLVMAIGECVRLDHDLLAKRALDRVAATVDLRAQPLDDGAHAAVGREREGCQARVLAADRHRVGADRGEG